MAEAHAPTDLCGAQLAHYDLRELIGSGAMGSVYLAHDRGLEREVAVKVLHSRIAQDGATVQRFAHEARAAARLNHPNLTHIYFVGHEESQRFFAMEYVKGEDLEAHVARVGPMDLETGIDGLVQVARGLAAAHAAGVVHRDVKPSNLIRRPDGTLKITDFGLAKSLDAEVDATMAGQVLGTPNFMSPEQCRGAPVTPQTDIYSLGLTAWYLFTGQPAFNDTSIGALINDQINTPLPKLASVRPDLPERLGSVLERLCAKRPEQRPPDMLAVAELFEALRPREVDPAPLAARAAALGIDAALTVPAILVIGGVAYATGLLARYESATGVITAALWLLLQVGSELTMGASPGKRFLQLGVAREDGLPPSRTQVLLRYAIRFPIALLTLVTLDLLPDLLDAWFVAANFLWIGVQGLVFWRAKGRTPSDLLTHTRVVFRLPRKEREAARKADLLGT